MNNAVQTPLTVESKERVLSDRIVTALTLLLLGSSLLFFTGFSHLNTVHNAAHDARHSAAFPCH